MAAISPGRKSCERLSLFFTFGRRRLKRTWPRRASEVSGHLDGRERSCRRHLNAGRPPHRLARMSELQKLTPSSRSSHRRRRPIGPAAFTGELGLPSSYSSRLLATRPHTTTTQASSLPPSTPSSSWAILGGRARHSTRSLSGVFSRSTTLLLEKVGAPPGMPIHDGRRAVDAPASAQSHSLTCRLSVGRRPH